MTSLRLAALAISLALVAAPQLRGQDPQPTEGIRIGLGGGLLLPTGDYATADKTGWHVLGLIQLPIAGSPIHLRLDGLYGSTTHQNGFSGSTKVAGGTADLLLHLGPRRASVRPYILGGVGLFNVSDGSSDTKFAFGGGGGILFGLGNMHAFLEARYIIVPISGSSLTFVPISAGLMLGQ